MIMKSELSITGQWIREKDNLIPDQNCRVINHMITEHLVRIADRAGDWIVLFSDPATGLFWELTYPQGEMQGGGPPKLTLISQNEVDCLYKSPTSDT